MRLAITGGDGQEHVVEFDSMPSEADIDEVAHTFGRSSVPTGMPDPTKGPITSLGPNGVSATKPVVPNIAAPSDEQQARDALNAQAQYGIAIPKRLRQAAARVSKGILAQNAATQVSPVQPRQDLSRSLLPVDSGLGDPDPSEYQAQLEQGGGRIQQRVAKGAAAANARAAAQKADPFLALNLPFSAHDFNAANDQGLSAVLGRNGQQIPLDTAIRMVQAKKGTTGTAFTKSRSQVEQDQANALSPISGVGASSGFQRGVTSANTPRGGARQNQALDPTTGEVRTPSQSARKMANDTTASVSQGLQSMGVHPLVADLIAGIPTTPLHVAAEMGTASDPMETDVNRLGAATNLAAFAAADRAGSLAHHLLSPLAQRALGALKASKVWGSIAGASTPEEAAAVVAKQLRVTPEEANAVVRVLDASGEPVNWKAEQEGVASSSRNSKPAPSAKATSDVPTAQEPAPSILAQIGTHEAPVEAPRSILSEIPSRDPAGPQGDPALTGTSRAVRSTERDIAGRGEPTRTTAMANEEAHASGQFAAQSDPSLPETLLRQLSDESRAATPHERGVLTEGKRQIQVAENVARSALDASTPDTHADLLDAYEKAKARATEWDQHLERVNAASGQSLQAIKIGTTLDEGDFAQVRAEAQRVAGADRPVGAKAESQLKKWAEVHEAQQARIAELEGKVAESEAQKALDRAPRQKRTVQAIRSDRAKAVEVFKTRTVANEVAEYEAKGIVLHNAGLRLLTEDQGKAIAAIAKSFAEEGVVHLQDVAERVIAHVKAEAGFDLTAEDVKNALTGNYERDVRQPRSRTAADQQIKAWQSEIKGASKAEQAAKADLDRFAREVRSKHGTQMRQEARAKLQAEHAAKQAEYERLFGERNRLDKSIQYLKERIETGDLSTKAKPERNKELERAYFERDQARKHIHRMIESQKPRSAVEKVSTVVRDVANIPRALKTTFDLSAPLRQGLVLSTANPRIAAKAFAEQLRAFGNGAYAHAANKAILEGDNAHLYKKAGLYLSDPESGAIGEHEEAFLSRFVGKIPGVENSERAYTTYLNTLRAGVFDKLTEGGTIHADDAKAIANFINVATGRGSLGKFEKAGNGLASILFSPRYLTSRFQILAATPLYSGGSVKAKVAIAKQMGTFAGTVFAVMKIAQAAGADVESDTTSSDFGKIRIGDTWIDMMGGMQQAFVFANRIAQGRTVSSTGNETDLTEGGFGKRSRADLTLDFARSKLAPTPGYAMTWLKGGRDAVGEIQDTGDVAKDFFTPTIANDFYESAQAQGLAKGVVLTIGSALGLSVSTQFPKDEKPPQMYDYLLGKAKGQ